MGASSIMMMIFAMVLLWGGMIAAILKLRSHPDEPEPDPMDRPQAEGGSHPVV